MASYSLAAIWPCTAIISPNVSHHWLYHSQFGTMFNSWGQTLLLHRDARILWLFAHKLWIVQMNLSKCAMYSFSAQKSAFYTSRESFWVTFQIATLPGFWSWGSSFRWDLIHVFLIYIYILEVVFFLLFWHHSVSALLTFSWLSEAVCQHLAEDFKSFVTFFYILTNISAIRGFLFQFEAVACCHFCLKS